MRIMISADMEGVTGVTCSADVTVGSEQWQRFRPIFTEDVNACVAGLYAGGAEEVVINEAHSSQRNLLLERLDPRVSMLTGKHKPLSMMEGIDTVPDGVVFLGYHAAAGADGVLAHTYLENQITGVWLDGVRASEGRLNAALAAEYGVPVILVTGDDKCCADAEDYSPSAAKAIVKTCVSRYAAVCLPPARSAEVITEAARTGMAAAGAGARTSSAHEIEVEFDASHLAAAAALIPTVQRRATNRIGFESASMTEAMQTFKVVTQVASGAVDGIYG
ncbi:M55 family metallopeptidase [Sciscionella sediminilitoris]|uniref:M55 family metallopeptidase n=1 Tax=Sciscionella sediminilitoris TaxID=1445613 RepID=UPI0004DECF57|nr:M55 family metallopeptidase [Sciscionella sp. SE31]